MIPFWDHEVEEPPFWDQDQWRTSSGLIQRLNHWRQVSQTLQIIPTPTTNTSESRRHNQQRSGNLASNGEEEKTRCLDRLSWPPSWYLFYGRPVLHSSFHGVLTLCCKAGTSLCACVGCICNGKERKWENLQGRKCIQEAVASVSGGNGVSDLQRDFRRTPSWGSMFSAAETCKKVLLFGMGFKMMVFILKGL